jgi:phytoene desaturase
MESGKTVIIIGGGIGGLSLAAMLGKKGFSVTVLEKNEMLGGRASTFQADGFTFDMGPSWYLMPDVFQHYFELMGEKVEDYLELQRLTPSYRIFFKDSPAGRIDMFADREKDGETFEKLEPGSSKKFDEYLARAKSNYEISKASFMYKNYDGIFDFLTLRMAIQGSKLSVFSTMNSYVGKFFKTPTMQKIMQYTLVFLGSSPYNTPALYSIMTYIDFGMGVFYPKGGIYKIIEALVKIGKKNGVNYQTNVSVEEILTENGRATGVRLSSGEIIDADVIVSNADIHHTETKLLKKDVDREYPESYWQKKTLSPSAFIMYLGFKDKVPSLTHHNLLFSKDWHKNFAEIFDNPKWPTDPSLYICAPSVTDPSVAPEGKENLFVLVPMAPGIEYTEEELQNYGEKILDLMERELDIPNIRERIEYKRYFCGKDFASRYNSYKGSALGLAHTLRQTAIFRPNTISKKVKNLYYVGANTNPGIGMPICLISAELVYKRLIGDKTDGPLAQL